MCSFSPSAQAHSLADLRAQIRALERPEPRSRTTLAFGLASIDARLPEGGLLVGALHEIRGREGAPSGAATLFAAALLARLEGSVLWCQVAADLFPPALAGVGLCPDRVIHVAVTDEKAVLLVLEEALTHPGLAGVLGELSHLSMLASRRLAIAAEKSGMLALALRRGKERPTPIAASTCWRVSPFPAPHAAWSGLPRALWRVDLLRCRGANPASWLVEAPDAAGYLALASVLSDRSTAPRGRARAHA